MFRNSVQFKIDSYMFLYISSTFWQLDNGHFHIMIVSHLLNILTLWECKLYWDNTASNAKTIHNTSNQRHGQGYDQIKHIKTTNDFLCEKVKQTYHKEI